MPHPTLLCPLDPAPAVTLRAAATSNLVFVCDHAGRAIPQRLGDLGVAEADLARHIAWDIGAGDLTRHLSERFDACAVLQAYSRLVIDCNREPSRADAAPLVSDGIDIPGNGDLDPDGRAERVAAIHEPYHRAIDAALSVRAGALPIFIHSFTPSLAGQDRPWRVGVLHPDGSRLATAALTSLRDRLGDLCGDNQPYVFDKTDYSANRHAVRASRDFLELEVRQDLLSHPDTFAATANLIAAVIDEVTSRP